MKRDCTNLYNQCNTLRVIIAFYSLILWTWWRNHKSEPACRHLRRSQCGRPNPHLSVAEMHVPWPAWSTPWSWPQNLLHMATLLNQIISFRYLPLSFVFVYLCLWIYLAFLKLNQRFGERSSSLQVRFSQVSLRIVGIWANWVFKMWAHAPVSLFGHHKRYCNKCHTKQSITQSMGNTRCWTNPRTMSFHIWWS